MFFSNIFGRIAIRHKNSINFASILKKYKNYLKSGTYFVNKDFNFIINKNKKSNEVKGYFNHTYISKTVRVKNSPGLFESLLICGDRQTVKLFNYNSAVVRTYFPSLDLLEKFICKRKMFCNHFSSPKILLTNSDENYLEEELVIDESNSFVKFECLLDFYSTYFKSVEVKGSNKLAGIISNNNIRKEVLKSFNDFFIKHNIDLDSLNWCVQHGDVWSANVFVTDGKPLFIDFDNTDEYPIFYDIVLFAFTEGFFNHDFTICKKIIDGYYDEWFKENCNCNLTGIQHFVICTYYMLLIRHETKKQYKYSDEIINFLIDLGVVK